MAATAHPPETRQRLLQAPLARTAALLPGATVGSAALPAVEEVGGGQKRPAEAGPRGPPAAPSSPAGAPPPGSRPGEHLCTAILDSSPQSLPPRGGGGKRPGTRGKSVQPRAPPGPAAELARRASRKDAGGELQRPQARRGRPRRSPSPIHTPLRSDSPNKLAPAAGGGRNPRGSGAAGGKGGRRSPGAPAATGQRPRWGGRRRAGREGGGKMESDPYFSTDCSFSSSFFCRSMTARMIFLSSSVRWLRSGISGCRGG